eukprot:TRINITY_DN6134_c0_g1_i1.p1 TRINITY_DN6134_c0_g1~~TRINITY_DN6134_c0_g1_i1.p1  ORF type:complete len:1270 (+),score=347.91 TRINITY_DN6134_c0_g1_i1:41-3811(+)
MATKYKCEYASTKRAGCGKCKAKIDKGVFRCGAVIPNMMGGDHDGVRWQHFTCWNVPKAVDSPADVAGIADLRDEDRAAIVAKIKLAVEMRASGIKPKKAPKQTSLLQSSAGPAGPASPSGSVWTPAGGPPGADGSGSFHEWQQLCRHIDADSTHTGKQECVKKFLKTFQGDIYLLLKLLLPKEDKLRVYHMKNKKLAEHFSNIWKVPLDEVNTDLEKGDVAATARRFHHQHGHPPTQSTLTLKEVDDFLTQMSGVTDGSTQLANLKAVVKKCDQYDIYWIIREMDKDLKINIGAKYALAALHPEAFDAFRKTNNLKEIVEQVLHNKDASLTKSFSGAAKASIGTAIAIGNPVKPMLAKACKSIQDAIAKCPKGMFSEIKYDGERIQIHKQGQNFNFYSRNLKVFNPTKLADLAEYIHKATNAHDIILDGEVVLIDHDTQCPLPFGTLGAHKKKQFSNASVGVFVFDILYLEGKSLLETPIMERRKLLQANVNVIPNHLLLSEMRIIYKEDDLGDMMSEVLSKKLEGLVMKDVRGEYEPAARHWLKIKKDYLHGMADSADLVVLGAYFGTGSKGGMMSTFLMGCLDRTNKSGMKQFKTVCKVGNGHDDKTLAQLQKTLKMVKISQDVSLVPTWLDVHNMHVPDFVSVDPYNSPIWEIQGAEFSDSHHHTAKFISIRFPRVTKIRDDKDVNSSTSLSELVDLKAASAGGVTLKLSGNKHKDSDDDDGSDAKPKAKAAAKKKAPAAKKPKSSAVVKSQIEIGDDGEDTDPFEGMDGVDTTSAHTGAPGGYQSDGTEDMDMDEEAVTAAAVPQPPVQYHTTTTTTASSGAGGHVAASAAGASYSEVSGDVTLPQGPPMQAKVIAHVCDDSGKWPHKGVFAAISARYADPQRTYEQANKLKLGDMQSVLVKVSSASSGPIHVCNLIAMESDLKGALNMKAFRKGLEKLNEVAKFANASVHMPRFTTKQCGWKDILPVIKSCLEVECKFYNFSGSDALAAQVLEKKQHVPSAAPATAVVPTTATATPAPQPKPKASITQQYQQPQSKVSTPPVAAAAPADPVAGILAGCVVTISGYYPHETQQLVQAVHAMGGQTSPKWKTFGAGKSTHLVCEFNTEEFAHVQKLGGNIVVAEWVRQCFAQKKRLPEGRYHYEGGEETLAKTVSDPTAPPESIFSAKEFCIMPTVSMAKELRRQLALYDADVVNKPTATTRFILTDAWSSDVEAATHVATKASVLRPDWAWACITQKQLLASFQFVVEKPE